jgi:hypothetical protein
VGRVPALFAVVVTFAGCGGSQSDSSQVTSVIHRYFAAVANADGAEACSLLGSEAKERLARNAAAFSAYIHTKKFLTCPQQVAIATAVLSSEARLAFRNPTVTVGTVSGNHATVRVAVGSRRLEVPLSKASGGWHIDDGGLSVSTSAHVQQVAPVRENPEALEAQLAAGEVRAATINKRIRTVHVTLSHGRKVLARYGKHEEPKVATGLRAKGVPVTIMTQAEAERDTATLRGE